MKILFVGHDISYAQFYSALTKELAHDKGIECFHIYLRPSANIYAKLIPAIKSSSLALSRLLGRAKENDNDEIDLKFYESALSNSKKSKLIKLYSCYKSKFALEINSKLKYIDVAIMPGEYRLFEQAIVNTLRHYSPQTKILYFEAGPPGYLYIDQQGVNANSSITKTKFSNILSEALETNKSNCRNFHFHQSPPKILKNSLLIIDLIWLFFFTRIYGGLCDLHEYNSAFINRIKKIPNKIFQKINLKLNKSEFQKNKAFTYLLYAGQVSSDVNSTHFGIKNEEILVKLYELLDTSNLIRIIWRDHPLEKQIGLFNTVEQKYKGRVFKLDNLSLDQSLSLVNGVVTVNSNTAIESLSKGLPLYLLGKAYYQLVYGVTAHKSKFIAFCNNHKIKGANPTIIEDIQIFIKNSFFPIDYRGGNYENIYLIRNYLINLKSKLNAK